MKKKSKNKYVLWTIMKPVILEIRVAMILSSFGTLSLISTLVVLSLVLSSLIEGIPLSIFGIEFNLLNIILLLSIMTIISFLSRLYSFVLSHLGAFKLEEVLRTTISQHLAEIPLGYIISNGSGDIKKVMQDDVRALHVFVADSIPLIAKSIISPLLILIVLFVLDYRLALASVGVLFLGWIAISFAMKDSKEHQIEYLKSQSDMNKIAIEFAQAMPVVRTFDDGMSSFSRYNNALGSFKDNLNKWRQLSATSSRLGMLFLTPLLTLTIVLITGFFFLSNGSLPLFTFIVALFLSTGMTDSVMQLMWILNFIKKAQGSALRIESLLDIQTLSSSKEFKTPNDFSLEFKKVFFKYDRTNNYAIKDVNFKAQPGSITALVGSSGAGKSTIAKLIPRFWDVSHGEILVGGVNIKDISSPTLMDTVSFVFQESFLFHDTLYNNIKMANPNAKDEEVIKAAQAAQIHDFIETLPSGYRTMVGERGLNFSGGQKQRIAIARAILRNSPIIVLDEATAFSDSENEEKIIKALANLTVNKTVIMIAHRLSTIKDADQIVVFEEGRITEMGNHSELLIKEGIYKNMWEDYEKVNQWNLNKEVFDEKK